MDRYWGAITITSSDYNTLSSETEFNEYVEDMEETYVCEKTQTVELSDTQAANGAFEDFETYLMSKKISFKRDSSGYCECLPETRVYDSANNVDETIYTDESGNPVIYAETLKKVLDQAGSEKEAMLSLSSMLDMQSKLLKML